VQKSMGGRVEVRGKRETGVSWVAADQKPREEGRGTRSFKRYNIVEGKTKGRDWRGCIERARRTVSQKKEGKKGSG